VRTKTSSQADKILQAAAQLFGSQRFHEVRMDDIADAAAVGKGTLYRYFKDKDELYLDVLRWESGQFLCRVRRAVEESASSARSQLVAAVRAIIEYFDDQPHLLALIQRAEVSMISDELFPWQQTRLDMLELIHGVFRSGEEGGEFRVGDPELATLILLGGLRGVIRFGKMPRPHDLSQRIVDGFLEGIHRYG
jgi:AcrR family transcriptional regulator